MAPRRRPNHPAPGQPADAAVVSRRVRSTDPGEDGVGRSPAGRRAEIIKVFPLRQGRRSAPRAADHVDTVPTGGGDSVCRVASEPVAAAERQDGACDGGGRTGRWGARSDRDVNGPAGRPRSPRPPSVPSPRGTGGAAAAPVRIAGRTVVGWRPPPLSGDGGACGSWSRSSTGTAHESAEPTGRGMDGARISVEACRFLGGPHEGPPIPLRQRRDSDAEVASARHYAHRGSRWPLRPRNRCRSELMRRPQARPVRGCSSRRSQRRA